jgi:PAS domain-containing protein
MINTDFQEIFKALPANYMVLDLDYRIVEVTDYHLKVLQRTRDIIGKNLFDAYPVNPASGYDHDNMDKLRKSLERVKASNAVHQMEILRYDIPFPDGFEVRYWLVKNIPVFRDGELHRILNTSIDITDLTKVGTF